MFTKARFKLTGWYLLIIMCISITFSGVIYQMLSHEVARFEQLQRFRIERRLGKSSIPPTLTNPELLEETRQRILLMLILVNAGIFVMAGGFGYILAGRTLTPIKAMVDEQNQFISDASHELRTPLTSLKSNLEVHLRDKALTLADAKKLISLNIDDVNRLQSLADALLQLTQYQKTNGNLVFEKISIQEAVREAVRKVQPLARKKHIILKNNTNDYNVTGNKYGLIDILVILLDNAVKYSPNNMKVIVEASKSDGYIELSVQDFGIGIEIKDIPHIFDRFYRVDSARLNTKAGGYGLGLSIAQKIIDAHHGTINVVSKHGKGSTFTIRLPVK